LSAHKITGAIFFKEANSNYCSELILTALFGDIIEDGKRWSSPLKNWRADFLIEVSGVFKGQNCFKH